MVSLGPFRSMVRGRFSFGEGFTTDPLIFRIHKIKWIKTKKKKKLPYTTDYRPGAPQNSFSTIFKYTKIKWKKQKKWNNLRTGNTEFLKWLRVIFLFASGVFFCVVTISHFVLMNPDFDSVRPRRVCVMIKPVFRPIRSVGMFIFSPFTAPVDSSMLWMGSDIWADVPHPDRKVCIWICLLLKWFGSLRAMFSILIRLHRKSGQSFENLIIYGFWAGSVAKKK